MDFVNLEILIIIQSNIWTKPINHFENKGVWVFIQICLETEILQKSRQIWTETHLLSCNKLNKGYIIFEFVFEIFFFPYPFDSNTFTN